MFSAQDISKAWGGIIIEHNNPADTSRLKHTFIVAGGGNSDYIFGHSESQAAVKAKDSNLLIENSYFMDNPGKGLGGRRLRFLINDSYFTRCDIGGEYIQCALNINRTYVIDIPDNDYILDDDDNDGMYFNAVHPSGDKSVLDSCVFITGEDDGIDHNGAILEILNCWIEDFYNEGIACSNTNSAYIYNTVVKGCEQGIEAGYGSPNVIVEHCVVIDNEVGIRFGDGYNWGCSGNMNVTNSIIYNNDKNIWNFDFLTNAPVEGAITIDYSMTNEPQYDDSPNCITGIPLFDENYFLLPHSPGKGLASNGLDMGLYNPNSHIDTNTNSSLIRIFPNPANRFINIYYTLNEEAIIKIVLYDNNGKYVDVIKETLQKPGSLNTLYKIPNNLQGIFFISVYKNNKLCSTAKVLINYQY